MPSAGESPFRNGMLGLGLNYPGLGVRYFLNNRWSAELKGQYEPDVLVAGLRGYRYFFFVGRAPIFLGVEADYVTFKGDVAKGRGFAGEVLAGCEYFIFQSLTLQFDFGPAFIYLNDKNYSISLNGLEYVINFGINYYFGLKSSKPSSPGATIQQKPDTDFLAAKSLYGSGDDDAVIRQTRKVLETDPTHWRAWGLLGNAYYRKGDVPSALNAYEESLKQNPDNSDLKTWVEKLRLSPTTLGSRAIR